MAYEFYITIEGSKQGKLVGESTKPAHKDKIIGRAFLYEVEAPRVAPTGKARGRRQHSPVGFVKAWGGASPQLYQALITYEVLKTVLFEFVQTTPEGTEQVFQTVKLYNATILSIKQEINPSKFDNFPDSPAIETVAMTFQRIEIENKISNLASADEWSLGV